MEINVAAATVAPVATAAGAASIMASKTSAAVSAKGSYNLVKVKLFSQLEFIHRSSKECKSSSKYLILLSAFYLIIWLMESPKSFEKKT